MVRRGDITGSPPSLYRAEGSWVKESYYIPAKHQVVLPTAYQMRYLSVFLGVHTCKVRL